MVGIGLVQFAVEQVQFHLTARANPEKLDGERKRSNNTCLVFDMQIPKKIHESFVFLGYDGL
jgi:hypothetical protein